MNSATFALTRFRRMRVGDLTVARKIPSPRLGRLRWKRGVLYLVIATTVITAALVAVGFHHVYFDRTNLPDIGPITRFAYPTIGHIYDANGQSLIDLAREYRQIIKYEEHPANCS